MNELEAMLQHRFSIVFKDTSVLHQAFRHSSYVNEHKYLEVGDNERLEFLGDAVLELIISEYLYHTYTDYPEGKLSKLRSSIVREESLSEFAKYCEFDKFLQLGRGEEVTGGRERPSLLCDLFEAFLGALTLDLGLEEAKKFIYRVMIPEVQEGKFHQLMDFKTRVQEELQKQGQVKITYQLVSEEGPSHAKEFGVELQADGKVIGVGVGRSKKTAEQNAAADALGKL